MARVTHLNVNHRGSDGLEMDANDIPFTPDGSIAATNVQDAIVEVRDEAGSPADIIDIPTAETDASLVLAPDGVGGVEFRAETGASLPWITDNVQPDAYPGSPTAFDDEFNQISTIDAKWTIVNDPPFGVGGTNAGFLYALVSELTTDNFDNLHRIYQTPPAGTSAMQFAAKVAITTNGLAAEFGEFASIAVYLGNSTNDEAIGCEIQVSNDTAGTTLYRGRGEQYTAGAAAAVTTDQVQVSGGFGQFLYVMLYKSTSNAYTSSNTYSMHVSANGIIYQEVGSMSKTFTTACDEVGIYVRAPKAQTGTPFGEVLADWFRQLF